MRAYLILPKFILKLEKYAGDHGKLCSTRNF